MFFDYNEDSESVNYWQSATDLFMTLFIIAVAVVVAVMIAFLPTANLRGKETIIIGPEDNIREPINKLRKTLELEAIEDNVDSANFVKKLRETCDVAVLRIEELSSKDLVKEVEHLRAENARFERINAELNVRNLELTEANKELQAEVDFYKSESESLKEKLDELSDLISILIETIGHISSAIIKKDSIMEDLKRLNDKPPMIVIAGKEKDKDDPNAPEAIVFQSGKATLKNEFKNSLRKNYFPKVEAALKKYESIDTLEIVGHTDGAKVISTSNLDESIASHFAGANNFDKMIAGSNCDLGLMRALAIRQFWLEWIANKQDNGRLKEIDIRCYSAAQTIPPEDSKAALNPQHKKHWLETNKEARRIEIRFTQLKDKRQTGGKKVLELPKGEKMVFRWCPPTNGKLVTLGSPIDEVGRFAFEIQEKVSFEKGFWMAEAECTQAQWEAVTGVSVLKHKQEYKINSRLQGLGDRHPMVFVNLEDIESFILKLNQSGSMPQEMKAFLPSGKQWEYACRAETTGPFHFGGSLDSSMANFNGNFPYGRGKKGKYVVATLPVKSFEPNAWGLYDMHGNVFERCKVGHTTESRGGGWSQKGERCRSAYRSFSPSVSRFNDSGFRICLQEE